MATYYVRPEGNDSNTGLGQNISSAWKTIKRALQSGSAVTAGDIVYVAPGLYNENSIGSGFGISQFASRIQIIGDYSASQFSGVNPGLVKISAFLSDSQAGITTSNLISLSNTGNFLFKNFYIEPNGNSGIYLSDVNSIDIENCVFNLSRTSTGITKGIHNLNNTFPSFIKNCIFFGGSYGISMPIGPFGVNKTFNEFIQNCLFLDQFSAGYSSNGPVTLSSDSIRLLNSTFITPNIGIQIFHYVNNNSTAKNCLFVNNSIGISNNGGSQNQTISSNCRFINCDVSRSNTGGGSNNFTSGTVGFELGESLLYNLSAKQIFSNNSASANNGIGVSSYFYSTGDIYNYPWTTSVPDIGALASKNLLSITPIYQPTEKQVEQRSITIGSTNQSFYPFLGVSGIGHTATGLKAYYLRTGGVATTIDLSSQTPTGSWVSGGFCEFDQINLPGIYRLDVPNAAFVSGSSDVTIVIRGLSTSNGAIINCKLENITADLLNTQAGIYTSSGTLGARLLQTVADNRPVIVTANKQIQIDSDQAFAAGTGATILDPIVNSVGRWTLKGDTMTLFAADGTYLRRVRLAQLGLSLNPS